MNPLFSSNKMDWETPPELFNKLNAIYKFSLDVAASEKNKKCNAYYDKEKDGLSQAWETDRGGGMV